eukprot:gene13523-43973_t
MADAATAGDAAALSVASPLPTVALLLGDDCMIQAGEERRLPVALHPLQFRVWGSVYAGCIIGNSALLAAGAAASLLLRMAAPRLAQRAGRSEHEVARRFQLPGVLFLFYVYLYRQGISYATMRILQTGSSAGSSSHVLLAALSLAVLCLFVPLCVWWWVLRNTAAQGMVSTRREVDALKR